MEYYFITGTSSGIGQALAEKLVSDHKVTGISRSSSLSHTNYHHHAIDLSKPGSLKDFHFDLPEEATRAVLINNAATIGTIDRTGNLPDSHYDQLFQLNLVALAQFCDRFLNEAKAKKYPCLIINISSGAGRNPIPSWAAYCASKAAVDMFTRVMDAELKEVGCSHIRVFSFHPGVIDTAMQARIRSVDSKHFSSKVRFDDYHSKGELLSPALVAGKILGIFKDPEQITDPVVSIRDYI